MIKEIYILIIIQSRRDYDYNEGTNYRTQIIKQSKIITELKQMTSYKQAGVNLDLGNTVSEILYNASKETWKNRAGKIGEVIIPFDNFSGLRYTKIGNLPEDAVSNMNFDGIGTKIEIAERMNNHKTVAFDLFAMVCDDAVIRGAEPVHLGSILDVNSLGKENLFLQQITQLAQGYIQAAAAANVAVINGEVAELGNRVHGYDKFNYNWGAGVLWYARESRLITGQKVIEKDFIVALQEKGFRSNGISLVRKILTKK